MKKIMSYKNEKINQFIEDGINKYGEEEFFNQLNNSWDNYEYDIRNAILDDIYDKIKPSNIETIQDLAKLLNGNEYGAELKNRDNINVEFLCKKNNWVIVFPYSDDCIEFRGAYYDELSAWDNSYYKFVKRGDFYLEDYTEYNYNDDDAKYLKAHGDMFVEISENEYKNIKSTYNNPECKEIIIEALWSPEELEYSWLLKCDGNVDFANFNIMEDDEIYAKCLIIDLNSLK